ncbi:hypothetical protein F5884DRAFT_792838 [Xylogone sp. PMI_703]|nr:hypothetical protein F5884DRAFT_792838 [Xylogone sp. PMI_703]
MRVVQAPRPRGSTAMRVVPTCVCFVAGRGSSPPLASLLFWVTCHVLFGALLRCHHRCRCWPVGEYRWHHWRAGRKGSACGLLMLRNRRVHSLLDFALLTRMSECHTSFEGWHTVRYAGGNLLSGGCRQSRVFEDGGGEFLHTVLRFKPR